jgi:hypothetical protein
MNNAAFKIIQRVERDGDTVTFYTDLPQGKQAEEIASVFKAELDAALKRTSVQGKTVRFNGRALLAMGYTAGFALRNAKAVDVDLWLEPSKAYYRVAGVHDEDSPIKFPWDCGMIVMAKLFGHEAEVQIVSVSLGSRVQVESKRQRAWIEEGDIIEFVRYARPGERI